MKIKPKMVDGEPVGNIECDFHNNGRCTSRCGGVYMTNCMPQYDTPCIPGLRKQRDELEAKLEVIKELCEDSAITMAWIDNTYKIQKILDGE